MNLEKKEEKLTGGKSTTKDEAIDRVARLVKELKGDRSIRKMAEDSGVAASYITAIINGKYLPSAEILRKLSVPYARPQNGITLEDLMIAAGYQETYVTLLSENGPVNVQYKTLDTSENYVFVDQEESVDFYENQRKQRNERRMQVSRFETMATGIIYKGLSEKQISFGNIENTLGIRGYKPDIALRVYGYPISEWWFEFKYISKSSKLSGISLGYMLAGFLFIEPKKGRKITLVISDELIFDNLRGYKNKLAYKGDLSVVLIDEDTFSIVDEIYLSHYDEENMMSAFYLK